MKNFFKSILFSMVLLFTAHSQAALSPLAVSIFPPVQFPPSDFDVIGLRLSVLYGDHRTMSGVDIGVLGNVTEQTFTGIGVSGLLNYTKGTTNIVFLQAAGLANVNTSKSNIYGLQIALGMNYMPAESTVGGVQLALANLSDFTNLYGVQLGLYNKARVVHGLQIGLVNVTENLHGLQIGLINFNHQGTFVVSPILNFGF